MVQTLIVFLGGGLGSTLRFFLSYLARMLSLRPWAGTLMANIIGTAAIFLVCKYLKKEGELSLFVKTGILGGLTTFSTFSLELVTMIKSDSLMEAAIYFTLNVVLGVVMGLWILR